MVSLHSIDFLLAYVPFLVGKKGFKIIVIRGPQMCFRGEVSRMWSKTTLLHCFGTLSLEVLNKKIIIKIYEIWHGSSRRDNADIII